MRTCIVLPAGQGLTLASIENDQDRVEICVESISVSTGNVIVSAFREGYIGIRNRAVNAETRMNVWGFAILSLAGLEDKQARFIVQLTKETRMVPDARPHEDDQDAA